MDEEKQVPHRRFAPIRSDIVTLQFLVIHNFCFYLLPSAFFLFQVGPAGVEGI
jgi:hypothetical protein